MLLLILVVTHLVFWRCSWKFFSFCYECLFEFFNLFVICDYCTFDFRHNL